MKREYDVIIIGGGIMGLLGAYEIIRSGGSVAVLEKYTVGSAAAGSSGLTRSLRSDYENPIYASLAKLSWEAWSNLEVQLNEKLIVQTGCVNFATQANAVTSYAASAAVWLARDGNLTAKTSGVVPVSKQYPQFKNFNLAIYEETAGLGLGLKTLTMLKNKVATTNSAIIIENFSINGIRQAKGKIAVMGNNVCLTARKLIVAAGLGTPCVLKFIAGWQPCFKLIAARPAECIYYYPDKVSHYVSDRLPVFAYLDKGIYGHPVVVGTTKGIKIGYYEPPASVNQRYTAQMYSIANFVDEHMPELAVTGTAAAVTDTDQCAYDMSADGGFILGEPSALKNVFIACGFCGTGYKFAPMVAEILKDFAAGSAYRHDISVFDPNRFTV